MGPEIKSTARLEVASRTLGGKNGSIVRALVAAAVLVALAAVLASGKIRCTSAALFGISCPMCGSTRALWALGRGDFAGVLHTNPVAPFVVAILVALGVRFVALEAIDGHAGALGEAPIGRALVCAFLACLILEIVVWALRFAGAFGGPLPV